jgi:hypothetical protein
MHTALSQVCSILHGPGGFAQRLQSELPVSLAHGNRIAVRDPDQQPSEKYRTPFGGVRFDLLMAGLDSLHRLIGAASVPGRMWKDDPQDEALGCQMESGLVNAFLRVFVPWW